MSAPACCGLHRRGCPAIAAARMDCVSRQPLRDAGSRPSNNAFARSRACHSVIQMHGAYEPASEVCLAISFMISGLPTESTILGLSRPLSLRRTAPRSSFMKSISSVSTTIAACVETSRSSSNRLSGNSHRPSRTGNAGDGGEEARESRSPSAAGGTALASPKTAKPALLRELPRRVQARRLSHCCSSLREQISDRLRNPAGKGCAHARGGAPWSTQYLTGAQALPRGGVDPPWAESSASSRSQAATSRSGMNNYASRTLARRSWSTKDRSVSMRCSRRASACVSRARK